MNFMNAVKNELNNQKTLTDNGAVAYATSGKKLTDFYFSLTALRRSDTETVDERFCSVYYENPLMAVKTLFQIRDCRGGAGERKTFRTCLVWLAENKPEIVKRLIPLVPEYGRWDDLWCLLDTDLRGDVIDLVTDQLHRDISVYNKKKNGNVSLLAKWLASENASSRETRRYGRILREGLCMTQRNYRKTLSMLRNHLDVVERKLSANEWGDVIYEHVPSLANVKYTDAFMEHDKDRRTNYLESLKSGISKINADVLQPHEIVRKYCPGGWRPRRYDEALEQLWKALPQMMVDNCLVVRDGSGSMCGRPLEVATALAVYTSEHNTGCWKDNFITFSQHPKFIDLSGCKTLRDKLVKTYNEDECSNTDIEATMMLILNTAIKNGCKQEDMPGRVLILSDMQFDSATAYYGGRYYITHGEALFDGLRKKYEAAGYKMPKLIFWNLSGYTNDTIPMQENELGVALISGFSIQLLNMVMYNELDPYKIILEAVNTERYQPVEDAVKDII